MPQNFYSPALASHPYGASVQRILQSALEAANPAIALQRCVRREGNRLLVEGQSYVLDDFPAVHLFALGKAAWTMTQALDALLDERLVRGLVIVKHAPISRSRYTVIEADHPLPGARSLAAAQVALAFLHDVQPGDLLICLLSGGGSALMTAPVPGVSLADLQQLTQNLLACGATIDEINTLRRHLDLLKGGGLLQQTQATVLSLILSDVVGNALETIASGPTAPDPTTRQDARHLLKQDKLQSGTPRSILDALTLRETLKPADERFERVRNVIVGNNLLAMQAAMQQAQAEGFHPYLLRADLRGEAREAAIDLSRTLRWAAQRGEPVPRPFCLLAGGETTVTLQGQGRGGRNTELALAAVNELAGFPDVMLLSLATDGEDGATPAAGAVVSGETWRQAETLGLQPIEYLNRNDSYTFFKALNSLIETGPTGTNVNDLAFLFGF